MTLTVSFGAGNPAVITRVSKLDWPTFAKWLTAEPPEVESKDARGWYCPTEFNPAYRDSENFVARYAITYDFDHVTVDTWGDVLAAWENTAFAIYTTFSHTPDHPRFRVVMPLSRPAGYDEFQAVARRVATDVGIDLFAGESFVPTQMMFAPARKLGGQFIARINDGNTLDVDAVLAEYADWTDRSSWPRRRDGDNVGTGVAHIDHLAKPGPVGEFNRTFTISQAIERFKLPYRRVS
jgi:hypothetical protein